VSNSLERITGRSVPPFSDPALREEGRHHRRRQRVAGSAAV